MLSGLKSVARTQNRGEAIVLVMGGKLVLAECAAASLGPLAQLLGASSGVTPVDPQSRYASTPAWYSYLDLICLTAPYSGWKDINVSLHTSELPHEKPSSLFLVVFLNVEGQVVTAGAVAVSLNANLLGCSSGRDTAVEER